MLKRLINKLKELKNIKNLEVPIFIKITSDISYNSLDKILPTIDSFFDGIIVSNTTQSREGLISKYSSENGGLSGKPLYERNLEMIKYIYPKVSRNLVIIGTGGISNSDDVIKMITAGASFVQIYTSLVYSGPSIVKTINQDLIHYMQDKKYSSIRQMIGSIYNSNIDNN